MNQTKAADFVVPEDWTKWQVRSQWLTLVVQLAIVVGCIWYLLVQPFMLLFGINLSDLLPPILSDSIDPSQKFKLAALVVAAFSPWIIRQSFERTDFLDKPRLAHALWAVHVASAVTAALFGLVLALHGLATLNFGDKNAPILLVFCIIYLVVCLYYLVAIHRERNGSDPLFLERFYLAYIEKKYHEVCIPYIKPFTINNGLSKGRITLGALSLFYVFIV